MAFGKGYGLHRPPLWGVMKARSFGSGFSTRRNVAELVKLPPLPMIFALECVMKELTLPVDNGCHGISFLTAQLARIVVPKPLLDSTEK